jgi:para-aminobenzoate synthetase component 1
MRISKPLNFVLNTFSLEKLQHEYSPVVVLNSNNETNKSLIAIGLKSTLTLSGDDFFTDLKKFINTQQDWVFGYFNYDLKNTIEPQLKSNNEDFINMDENHFFVPQLVIEINNKNTIVHYHNETEYNRLISVLENNNIHSIIKNTSIQVLQKESKISYIDKIESIKQHIQLGDIYEMNYCHEFYAKDVEIANPASKYFQLNEISKAPFSVYYKNGKQYILSASPERFLKKEGDKITSQPIKGTAKRGETPQEDLAIKTALKNDPKERSENIMIVDLVRNDLSKTAIKASVTVEELCEIYTFDTVHQMISTVTSLIDEKTHPVDVIKNAYPMGSMTGAPKVEAMKLIESFEETKRGIYSGAIGYFTPNLDFDFNVVIRSILYNQAQKKVSFMVGGAITLKSDSEKEYEETLLKADALIKTLNN